MCSNCYNESEPAGKSGGSRSHTIPSYAKTRFRSDLLAGWVGLAGVCPAEVHLVASRRRVHNASSVQQKKASKMPSIWLLVSTVG